MVNQIIHHGALKIDRTKANSLVPTRCPKRICKKRAYNSLFADELTPSWTIERYFLLGRLLHLPPCNSYGRQLEQRLQRPIDIFRFRVGAYRQGGLIFRINSSMPLNNSYPRYYHTHYCGKRTSMKVFFGKSKLKIFLIVT